MLRQFISAAALGLSLTACAYHIESAIPDSQAVFDPTLVGTWITADLDTAILSASGAGYHITYAEHNGSRSELVARMGTLGSRSVLEVWPRFGDDDEGWPMGRLLMALTRSGDTLQTALVKVDSLRAAIASGAVRTPHLVHNGDVILTGTTTEVSSALAAALSRAGMLDEAEPWRRVAPK